MATDLRVIFAVMAICEDLDRIGHHATSIMRQARRLSATAAAPRAGDEEQSGAPQAPDPDSAPPDDDSQRGEPGISSHPMSATTQELPNSVVPLSHYVKARLHDVLAAFRTRDTAAAYRILEADDEIDTTYDTGVAALLATMGTPTQTDATMLERGMVLLRVMHKLERIGDRVTNIAERIVFLNTGDLSMGARSVLPREGTAGVPRPTRQ